MPVEWVAYGAFALAAVAVLVGVGWAASGHADGLAPAPPDAAPEVPDAGAASTAPVPPAAETRTSPGAGEVGPPGTRPTPDAAAPGTDQAVR
jgi:hypothetical protein